MSKKKLFLFFLISMCLPVVAMAQLHSYGPAITIGYIINNIVGNLWIVFAGIAVIMFLYAGIMFLTANGEPQKISTARMAFLWGVVGVVVGIISYSIIFIVGNLIGV